MSCSVDVLEAMRKEVASLKKQPSSAQVKKLRAFVAQETESSKEKQNREDITRLAASSGVKMPRGHLLNTESIRVNMPQAFTGRTRAMQALQNEKTIVDAAMASEPFSRRDCKSHGADAAELGANLKNRCEKMACVACERTTNRVESKRRCDKVAGKMKASQGQALVRTLQVAEAPCVDERSVRLEDIVYIEDASSYVPEHGATPGNAFRMCRLQEPI